MSSVWRWAAIISRMSLWTDGRPRTLRSALTMHRTAWRAAVRDSHVTGVSALAHVDADALDDPAPTATQVTNNATRLLRIWTPSESRYGASSWPPSTWTKGRVEQPFSLSTGIW